MIDFSGLQSVRVEREGPRAEIVLIGPGKGNAMGPSFFDELPRVVRALDDDPEVRVVIIRGAGKCFCYGLDLIAAGPVLGALISGPQLAPDRTKLYELIQRWQESATAIARAKKPMIAAVHGACIGGGLDLIAACDVRVCAADSVFSLREVHVAIVADLGSLQRLPAIIGEGNTRELALTGSDFGSARAERMGLVSQVFDTPDALLSGARALADRIATLSPIVLAGIKQVLNEAMEARIAERLRHVALWNAAFLASEDLGEAMAAFVQKRKPEFKGR